MEHWCKGWIVMEHKCKETIVMNHSCKEPSVMEHWCHGTMLWTVVQGNKYYGRRCKGYSVMEHWCKEPSFCLFVSLFIAAWAIFQLSGGCHHYRWQGCKFRPMLGAQGLW
jgi:hypothetical protein